MELLSIPAIVAIVELVKGAGMPTKLAPVVSVVLGVCFSLVFCGMTIDCVGTGLVLGLGASGLYSGGKTVLKKPEVVE